MAAVTVFVDRAVTGDLPAICVRTGEPATHEVAVRKAVGSLGWAWILVVLGPPGWLALALASISGAGRETLEVTLPYSTAALARYRFRNRMTLWAWVAFLPGGIAALTGGLTPWLWAPVALGGLAVALVGHVMLSFDEVDLRLDGSRRWVTLNGVHERFADALAAEPRAAAPPA
ncbi:MAG TPA: hypothetical protein VIG64_06290 [Actinomycetota bacterium]|jgi:hypothetical protein